MKRLPVYLATESRFKNLPAECKYSLWIGELLGHVVSEHEIEIMPPGWPNEIFIKTGPMQGYCSFDFLLQSAVNEQLGLRFETIARDDVKFA